MANGKLATALPGSHRHQKPAILQNIEKWPHWETIVAYAVKEEALTQEEAQTTLPEYQRFLTLLTSERRLGMHSSQVDKLWHAHLLHTQLYRAFCQDYLGRMIDHMPIVTSEYECETGPDTDPVPVPPPKPSAAQLPTAAQFFRAYLSMFGEVPGPIWDLSQADGAAM